MSGFSLKDIPAGGGAIPAGQYRFKFNDVEPGVSGAGNAKLTLKATVVEGPLNDRKVVYSRSLMPNAIWKLRDDLIAAGVAEDAQFANPFEDPQGFGRDVRSQLVGKLFDVKVETTLTKSGPYAGKPSTEYTILGKLKLGGADAFDSV